MIKYTKEELKTIKKEARPLGQINQVLEKFQSRNGRNKANLILKIGKQRFD